jgi:peptidoglycan/LPS O-acetylase OafA/YrhL
VNSHHSTHAPYLRLLAMVVLSFLAMYVLMYAMVDQFSHVYNNINQVYMAALMAAPMVLIELLLMQSMYPDRRLNVVLLITAAVALAAFWFLIREQTLVSDRQFLRSMIPHHAGAILMCEKNSLEDKRLQALCQEIVRSQRAEIAQMQTWLAERQK